ncbi:hypothetical protein IT396_02445 [Candidatus Nomurabacteria bacterium]|nr:hypothetical protein [Candidatus Nomurabacteria bacterium]
MSSFTGLSVVEQVARQRIEQGPATSRDVAHALSKKFKTKFSTGVAAQIVYRLRRQKLVKKERRTGRGTLYTV